MHCTDSFIFLMYCEREKNKYYSSKEDNDFFISINCQNGTFLRWWFTIKVANGGKWRVSAFLHYCRWAQGGDIGLLA